MNASARALALLAIAAALLGVGGWAGHTVTDNAWEAKQAKEREQQHQKYLAEVERGDRASTNYLKEHRDQEERYAQIDDSFKQFRVRSGLYAAPRLAPPVAVAGAAPAADPTDEASAPGCVVVQLEMDAEPPPFNLGAIWMWNSALAGRNVPAGACGTDAAASEADPACTESSGLNADDAWDNHIANAKSCAEDRTRYRHLIEFLQGKKTNAQQ